MIINGKKVAEGIYDELKKEVQTLESKPKLAIILVGNNPASLRYIAQKEKWAKFVGIDFHLEKMDENITEKEVLEKIQDFNTDKNISGFMVQLPVAKHISEEKIIHAICPKKDVDGFHGENLGKVMIGDTSGFVPCTPAGIMELLQAENIELAGKNVCVIGRSNIVGKPVANLLINAGATVSICNSKTGNLEYFTKNADIVVVAAGVPHLLKVEMLKEHAIVIDVGFTVIDGNIYGDADTQGIQQAGHHITPVPGGVGPMTVAMLMKNTIKARIKQQT